MQRLKKRVVILGGGPTGLAAADVLSHDCDVTLFEVTGELGGLAGSFFQDGHPIPKFYHHIFAHDLITLHYLQRYGERENMVWQRIKMCILTNGKLYNFTDPLSLLRFDYLSLWGRFRYGLFGVYVLGFLHPEKISDDCDAQHWLVRYAGKEVTDKLFYQLQGRNKFGITLDKISAKQFAHRLKAGEAWGTFGFPRKGYQVIVDGLAQELRSRDVEIILSTAVTSVDVDKKVVFFKNQSLSYDALITTIPVPVMLQLTKGLPPEYVQQLSRVEYCPVVSVIFGAKEFLSPHYWLNVLHERIHMIVQHSQLYDGYPQKVIWASRYGNSIEDFTLSDDALREVYLGVVRKYFPSVDVIWSKVFRNKYAEPIYTKDYPTFQPQYRTPISSLYWAGIAVTYPEIRNTNTALISGHHVAELVLADFRKNA